MPLSVLCGQFALDMTLAVLSGYVSRYMPQTVLGWGVSLTCNLLFYVGSFSYMPLAVSCGEFLLHAPNCFMWGVSLTCPCLFYVESFSYKQTKCFMNMESFS